MIQVHIEKRAADGKILAFKMKGHADFAEYGEDIVCAGASAVSFGTVNAIMALANVEPVIKQSESGLLECRIPEGISKEADEKVQTLLEGMVVSLQTIERDYGKHIKINFQ
ncbi:ribosomal-processing cysteine protease Prp [Heyndrickxia acidiproducens]|uniref:ribosomal-processing cysteine protease Prp n=1 Tax=Heyndrickxia acidiproducens TaxID=1121084 RepID=UPI00036ED1F0|nr:ribosomal-processing cysteine protease Prp [Heyndrickxia acidiproducens]